ncbi:hypothetical protein [Streptomyces sp. 8N616]|uniref:hypothetical protein n=1 Tax=Streptomyces sp. 8N616 TaxID=3457414 RepID=UPI003FD2E658
MAPALRSRFAIGLLVGAAMLPAPTALAREQAHFPVERRTSVTGPQILLIHPMGRLGISAPYPSGRAPGAAQVPGPDPSSRPGGPSRPGSGSRETGPPEEPSAPPGPGIPSGAPPGPPSAAPPSGGAAEPSPPTHAAPHPPGPTPDLPSPPDRDELEGAWRPPLPYEPQQQEPVEPEWTEVSEAPADPSSTGTPDPDSAAPSTSAEESGQPAGAHPSGRMLRVLPIGTGLALMGFGLAYIGIRLRQH